MQDYKNPILDETGNPIKIGFLAFHHCIRCIKQARALKSVGYEVHGCGNRTVYGIETYDTYQVWTNELQFKNAVRVMIKLGCRILHYHNEPDFGTVWCKQVVTEMGMQDKVKVITDLHDIDCIRKGVIPLIEREMFLQSDGLVYVSTEIQKIVNRLHDVHVPNTVLYSYCNKDLLSDIDFKNVGQNGALVYEGGLTPPTHKGGDNTVFKYRDLYPITKQLVDMGNEVHLYCGNLSAYKTYQDIGAVLYPPTDYTKMMQDLPRFKYGLIVFNNREGEDNQVNFTLTNKMQEYLAAGIPSIVCWAGATGKYVSKHKIGFVFKNIEDIGNLSHISDEQYQEVRNNVLKKRELLVMENFIHRTENLYAEVLGLDKKAIPKKIERLSDLDYK